MDTPGRGRGAHDVVFFFIGFRHHRSVSALLRVICLSTEGKWRLSPRTSPKNASLRERGSTEEK